MDIIFPFAATEFREDYFERKPALFPAAVLGIRDAWPVFDDALSHVDPTPDYIKLLDGSRVGQGAFVEEYVDIGVRRRRIRKEILHARMAAGATLVVNRMDIFSPAVGDICMQISRFAGAQASANGYASFGGEPATDVHWDTHDVFVVQLAGRKLWKLYAPTLPLPISSQTSTDRKDEVPDTVFSEQTLETGDILYVPRGWWHRVAPIDQNETFHLAVGVHAPLVLDYVIWACANRLPADLSMRHSLAGRTIDSELIKGACQTLAEVLRNPANVKEFYDRSKGRERVVSPFRLGELFGAAGLGSGVLQVNSRYEEARAQMTVNGQARDLSTTELSVVRAVLEWPNHDVSDLVHGLSDLDAETAKATIRSLIISDVLSFRPDSALAGTSQPLA